ncbi:MAG: flagellar hook-basal body protein [Vallitaleaceae bacterium]|nr:flagellar hook-basal body protein [Vallitaleaceae bacterium]
MMRSLWTAASGMKTQQMTVDTIANNLANVNTVGFKKERLEFRSLLYETLREAGSVEQGGEPVNLQVGHGVRASGSVKIFTQGNLERTEAPLDFAIEGNGFFAVQDSNGNLRYTKDGTFKLAIYDDQLMLTTMDGHSVLSNEGEPIFFEGNIVTDRLIVNESGNFSYMTADETIDLGVGMQLSQFRNPAGLKSMGDGYYETTVASGEALLESEEEDLEKSSLIQGAVEASNVMAVEEMVKMIIAQRAYELSSKAIQTSDDMLSLANNLKR